MDKRAKLSMYKRKTYDKFFIACRNSFDQPEYILTFNFKTEKECDKKLAYLNERRDIARADPAMHPFGWQSSYRKVKKRLPSVCGRCRFD